MSGRSPRAGLAGAARRGRDHVPRRCGRQGLEGHGLPRRRHDRARRGDACRPARRGPPRGAARPRARQAPEPHQPAARPVPEAAVNLLLAAACLTIVAGALLQAATGFGFSLLAAPLTFAAVDPAPAAVGLLLLVGAEVNLLTLAERRRPQPLRRSSAIMLGWAAPGALAGVAVLRALPAVALQVAVTLGVVGTLAARRAAGRRAHV